MDYVEILATGLTWYAIGGVALLLGSVVVYGVALFFYWLLAQLVKRASQLLSHIAGQAGASLRHHPFR